MEKMSSQDRFTLGQPLIVFVIDFENRVAQNGGSLTGADPKEVMLYSAAKQWLGEDDNLTKAHETN